MTTPILLPSDHGPLPAWLDQPDNPRGVLLLAQVAPLAVDPTMAAFFTARDEAVLAIELLTAQEMPFPDAGHNVARLTERLLAALDFIRNDDALSGLPLGLYALGQSTPAAIRAAARRDRQVNALICHGGLLDPAGREALELLATPLLILLEAGTAPSQLQRAISHLQTEFAIRPIAAGESPAPQIADWLAGHLPPV